jgi:glycosyltransferase involved in cell wall biosynthesis
VGKWLLPLADGCVFQTEQAKAWFPQRLQRKSQVIMNQVDESFFSIPDAPEHGYVMTAGRLTKQKNQAMLIRAFASITDKVDEELRIYGQGELEPELAALIRELKMEDRIKLMGATDDVQSALAGASLFVLPSDFEGMPNALLEAMAAGRPCIATDCPCGGPRAALGDNEFGRLVAVGDEKGLADNMLELLQNITSSNILAHSARQKAAAFAPQKVFSVWREYVESIIT